MSGNRCLRSSSHPDFKPLLQTTFENSVVTKNLATPPLGSQTLTPVSISVGYIVDVQADIARQIMITPLIFSIFTSL
jgi:hypothetical protein